jgi:hypothetical protein
LHCRKDRILHEGDQGRLPRHARKAKFLREGGDAAFLGKSRASSCRKFKKGQLVFEFVVAMVFFLGIVVFIVNFLTSTMYTYSADSFSGEMKSKASQIAEVLLLSKGNWSKGEPVSVGLAEEWPVLNSSKIMWLQRYCEYPDNYTSLVKSFWIDPKNVSVKIIIDENVLGNTVTVLECPIWLGPSKVRLAETKRYAVLANKNMATAYVYVWR